MRASVQYALRLYQPFGISFAGQDLYHGKKIPATLKAVCAEVLGTIDYNSMVFDTLIERIEVPEDNHLRFIFKDGERLSAHGQTLKGGKVGQMK